MKKTFIFHCFTKGNSYPKTYIVYGDLPCNIRMPGDSAGDLQGLLVTSTDRGIKRSRRLNHLVVFFFSKKVKHLVVDFSLSHCFPRFFYRVVKGGGSKGRGFPNLP